MPESRSALPDREPDEERWGVCLSGGGVRSASYCLGALQVLREEGVLNGCEYVSAVSGGSYIASAFATTAALTPATPGALPVFAPGSPEEQHLRNNSSYMAPGAAGKARLVLRVLLGMVPNLLLVGVVLLIAFWPLSWFYAAAYPQLHDPADHGWLDPRWWMFVIPVAFLLIGTVLGLDVLSGDEEREKGRRVRDAWSERAMVVAVALAVAFLAIPQIVLAIRGIASAPPDKALAPVGLAGTQASKNEASGHAAGWLALINVGALTTAALGALSSFVAKQRRFLLLFAAFVSGPLLVLCFVLLVTNAGAVSGLGWEQALVYALTLVVAFVAGRLIDLTQWSLHPFYRRRLSTAFFVRRNESGGDPTAVEVPPDQPLFWETLGYASNAEFPRLLVCAAANATQPGATPPGRAAVPFVFTGGAIGTPNAEVTPAEYRQVADRWRFLSVPAAVAMSGAAVSPLMGKKTIRAVRFLMALMNVRLGVWMPNPVRVTAGAPSGERPHPLYLFKEMLGLAKLEDPFLYVTDGGHFDNLGLIELLRRGCTTVFCIDGGGDPPATYRALGEAVALARSELQVDVKIDPTPIDPSKQRRLSGVNFVIGRFRYRSTPLSPVENPDPPWTGTLIYCRAAVTADAPYDVLSFASRDKRFPNHSTFDQLFDDEKFESYRALGAHTMRRAIAGWRDDLAARV